jgi:proteasome lid subunit RPN8/RPN11
MNYNPVTYLWLPESSARAIADHAYHDYPREACGLIAGVGKHIQHVIPIANKAEDPLYAYRMDDKALTTALFALEKEGLALLGFYHSHPNGDPIPSQTDIGQAYYPDLAYLIVGLRSGKPRFAAWKIHYGRVTAVELYDGLSAPEPNNEVSFSHAQKIAVLVAAIIAFAFMIVLSLSLLPPAPIIVNLTPGH